jgi:Lon protease-like protein
MDHKIPIFPLQLVIFPSSKYPLHIFEARYKNMINYCLENNKGFGIVAQINTETMNVGSYVEIFSVLKKYDNGEMDIIVQGKNRFFIGEIDVHLDGYFVAEVSDYSDDQTATDSLLLDELKQNFEELLKKVNLQLDEAFWNNFINSSTKSFKIAEKAGLSLPEQQKILILKNENERLEFLRDHLANISSQLEKNLAGKTIVLNDGFVQ